MKAIRCNNWGLPDTLTIEELPNPSPEPGQVAINVKAAGVNFPDVLVIQNKYQFKPDLPFTPGSELSGVVSAVGVGVKHVKAGDRVIAFIPHGAFAQQVVVSANSVMPMPPEMAFDTAAAFALTYGTSHHALVDRAQLKPGETLLVLGAAGGVGLAAIEIGKAIGARVIAAASSDEKLDICRLHGADATINYTKENLRGAIKATAGEKGPDVIYDPVGGIYTESAFRSIAWRGRYLVVGFANGDIPKIPLNIALLKGASLVGVFWGEFAKREPQASKLAFRELMAWWSEGKIKPHISGRYALKDTAAALNDLAARKATGKIVILPEE
jgi:NADPH2:quinone reductase